MTVHDIVAEIPRLTVEERLAVLDAITQSLRTVLMPPPLTRESVVDRLYGAFKTNGPPLTDADVERLRYEVLLEKYS